MKKARGINLAIIILSSILIAILGFGYSQVNSEKIAKNTYIKDINVGNLSREEAKLKIKENCKFDTITFTYKDEIWVIEPSSINANYNIDKTIDEALKVNRSSNVFSNIIDMIKSNFGIKKDINVVLKYDKEKLEKELENIAKEINIDKENARIQISDGDIEVKKEKAGIQLDIKNTISSLEKSLQDGIYKENLVVTKVEPEVIEDDLKDVDILLGSYKTILSDRSEDRVSNIKLATKKTSGVLLMPGEEFSYNKHTGMRTEKNGYKKATVIMSGEAVNGVGGGVCQVSTTLYNAVLYAGLDIVKVSNHSIPSSYVSKGRDATVSDNGLDFIFKNNYNKPVYIENCYSDGEIICKVYGHKGDKQDIEIVTNTDNIEDAPVKKEKDPTLLEGKEKVVAYGRSSYTVSTYRVYYKKDGTELKREKIATSYYPPKQQIIVVGTKKKENKENEVLTDNNYSSTEDKNENNKNNTTQEDNDNDSNNQETDNDDNIEENQQEENKQDNIKEDNIVEEDASN